MHLRRTSAQSEVLFLLGRKVKNMECCSIEDAILEYIDSDVKSAYREKVKRTLSFNSPVVF